MIAETMTSNLDRRLAISTMAPAEAELPESIKIPGRSHTNGCPEKRALR
jgi:hypothetical protein